MSEKQSNRAKHGTATDRLTLRMTKEDVRAINELSATANQQASITDTAVVRRAIHSYRDYLCRLDPERLAREVLKMQKGTYAAA